MLRIETLGGFRVEHTERSVGALLNYRLRCALLAFVAVERETTRDRAAALLWPDSDPAAARHSLSQALYELRRLLGASWMESAGDHLRISGEVELDVAAFEAAVAREDWGAAIALYGGAFLEGEDFGAPQPFEEWTARTRARLEGAHRRARRGFIEQCLAADRLPAALAAAREWVAIDPLEDEAQHRLISLLSASGQRAEALRQYERYERLLKDELDLIPLDETRELVQRLRAGDTTAPPAGAGAPEPARRRLPDAPERARRPALRWAAAAAVVLIAPVLWLVFGRGGDAPAVAEAQPHRIAVLPLRSIGTSERVGNVAAGLTDGLIERLGAVRQLEVLSANTVLQYADSMPGSRVLLERYGVGTLVNGTVQEWRDNSLRVRIELTDAASGDVVDGRTFAPTGELFALQDTLEEEVTRYLRRRLGDWIELSERRSRASDVQAWEEVQRSVALLRQARGLRARTPAGGAAAAAWLEQADSALARAARRDPRWTVPWIDRGWIALQQALAVTVADSASFRAALERGLAHADRALAIDPADPRALELRGSLLVRMAQDLPGPAGRDTLVELADSALQRAVRADPTRADAWNSLALLHLMRGDFEGAVAHATTALEEDAYLTGAEGTRYRLFDAAWKLGDFDAARRWCQGGDAQFGNDWRFAHCRLVLMASDPAVRPVPDSAWALLERIRALMRDDPTADTDPYLPIHRRTLVAEVLVRAGLRDSAQAVLSAARERALAEGFAVEILMDEARTRITLGDHDAAIRALEQLVAAEPGVSIRRYIARLHVLQPLRADPRFQALVGDTTAERSDQ